MFQICQDRAMEKKDGKRRDKALSRDQVISAAIAILNESGESGLTFRTLAQRLATGPGAIYNHVQNKQDLLAAAADVMIQSALSVNRDELAPGAAIRAVALDVFDIIDAHPWVGMELSRAPWQPAMLLIFDRIGANLQALGVPDMAQFHAASTVTNFILGAAAQQAAAIRLHADGAQRATLLSAAARAAIHQDKKSSPFLQRMAGNLTEHDDREQFSAGVDLILRGISG